MRSIDFSSSTGIEGMLSDHSRADTLNLIPSRVSLDEAYATTKALRWRPTADQGLSSHKEFEFLKEGLKSQDDQVKFSFVCNS